MATSKVIVPPDPARLIHGLRDTGYEFNTALADVVDNSIAAEASNVYVNVGMDYEGQIQVLVADNGCGMDRADLLNAMTYGAKTKRSRLSLGKFGLGLKTASTAFCRRLSVISRASRSDRWLKAQWDIDHVAKVGEWELLFCDVTADEKAVLDRVAKSSSGTLVVWDKVDRVIKDYSNPGGTCARNALDKVIEGFRLHASMVYQRFLDPRDKRTQNIKMYLNDDPVEAWDPFCERMGPKGELVAKDSRRVRLSTGKTAEFLVRAFVIPRREEFADETAAKQARLTNNMQGVYVYRENRLIHGPDWLNMFSKEPHLTLLRIEFSFDHKLDDAFDVDIKKSRILLNETLYDWLNDFLAPPRRAADDRYRKGLKAKIDKTSSGAHDASNVHIGQQEVSNRLADVTVKNAKTGEVVITNPSGQLTLTIPVAGAAKPGEVVVQPVKSIDDNVLWEPCIIDTHHGVRINKGHPYYHKVYVPNLASGVTIQGMDSLLWALCEAELGTVNSATKDHFAELRFEVSKLLRRLVKDLPDPDLDDDDDS